MRERHLLKPRLAKTMQRGAESVRRADARIRKKDTVTEQMQEELRAASSGVLRVTSSSLRRLKPVLKYREKRRQKPAIKEKAEIASDTIGGQNRQAVQAKPMSQSNQIAAAKHADNARRMQARLQSVAARVKQRAHRTVKTAAKALLHGMGLSRSGVYLAAAVVVVVLLSGVCLVGLLLGSSFGIFFSNETENGMTTRDVVAELSGSYYAEIGNLQAIHPHDAVELVSDDGTAAVRWPQVLSVYAALLTKGDDTGVDVVTMTQEKKETLQALFWEMNELTASTYPRTRETEKTVTDEYGEQQTVTETVTETVLQIHIKRTAPRGNGGSLQLRRISEGAVDFTAGRAVRRLLGQSARRKCLGRLR